MYSSNVMLQLEAQIHRANEDHSSPVQYIMCHANWVLAEILAFVDLVVQEISSIIKRLCQWSVDNDNLDGNLQKFWISLGEFEPCFIVLI